MKLSRIGLIFICTTFVYAANSQVVWENHHSEVYNYLSRMAQKGLITYNDNIRPLSRIYIEQCLDSLQVKTTQLSSTEKKELQFYQQEFTDNNNNAGYNNVTPPGLINSRFFKQDAANRWRAFSTSGKDFLLRFDPVITAAYINGTGKDYRQYSTGFNLYGYAGKHWGWYVSFNDINEKGTGFDTLRQNTPETGIVGRIADNKKSQNFSELRGGISYNWKNGSISFGQDHLLWGYGENGQIVLSGKPPTYPYIRLDYKPLPWLTFNYTHAWLNSNILDSIATYRTGTNVYGGVRQFYIKKFMAMHSVQVTPTKGLDISVGESMVYSDRLDVGYLIPILFFKAYDNLINGSNNNAGSNGQFFAQISSRNNIPKTHLYGTLFIDEIHLSTIFDKIKSRNQVGATFGASITDVFVPYLTLGLEYTRINPFVYSNLIPAQHYTSDDYVLGDWMGNNADRLIYSASYTPFPRLKCHVRYQTIRKGGQGTIVQQYFQQPQPPFLFDLQNKRQEWYGSISYEWIPKLYLTSYFSSQHIDDQRTGLSTTNNTFSIGVSYGL